MENLLYRHTFLFLKKNITSEIKLELENYIKEYHEMLMEMEKESGFYLNDLFAYNSSCILDYSEFKLPSNIFAVVFYGSDWMSFINSVLDFNEAFPSSKISREEIYKYVLLDENGSLEDKPDIKSN